MLINRKFILTGIVFFLAILLPKDLFSQTRIPEMEVRDVHGKSFDLGSLKEDNKPLLVLFWATWCKPCIEEMDNLSELYEEWQEEIDFEIIAVCIDDTRSASVIRSFVAGKDWPFRIIMDVNQDIKRAMNVTIIPHSYLFDHENRMVYKHTGYNPGNEYLLYDELMKLDGE